VLVAWVGSFPTFVVIVVALRSLLLSPPFVVAPPDATSVSPPLFPIVIVPVVHHPCHSSSSPFTIPVVHCPWSFVFMLLFDVPPFHLHAVIHYPHPFALSRNGAHCGPASRCSQQQHRAREGVYLGAAQCCYQQEM
jgi:hypothetical protein